MVGVVHIGKNVLQAQGLSPPVSQDIIQTQRMTTATIGALAPCGGSPLFDTVLHVGRPHIADGECFLTPINDVFNRHWLRKHGPQAKEPEGKITALLALQE